MTKILLITTGLFILAILLTAFATDTFPGNGFFLMVGAIALAAAACSAFVGVLFLFKKDKKISRGLLLSSAFFGILGLVCCFVLNQY